MPRTSPLRWSWPVAIALGLATALLGPGTARAATSVQENFQTAAQASGAPGGFTPYSDSLSSVSCITSTQCVAVGSYNNVLTGGTVAEEWDGSTWSVMPTSAPVANTHDVLNGVACVSATDCVAVGDQYPFNAPQNRQTLTELWDGTSWSITSSQNPGNDNALSGVSCTDATDCTAVGLTQVGTEPYGGLVETWDGNAWSASDFPRNSTGPGQWLSGVSCVSSGTCTAVGGWSDPLAGTSGSLIGSWSNVSCCSIVTGNGDGDLYGLTCMGPTDCVLVGWDGARSWNGTSSSPMPGPTLTGVELSGVSCTDAADCMAVGFTVEPYSTFAEAWDGTSWTITPTPNPGGFAPSDYLYGVSCNSGPSCMAVGTNSTNPVGGDGYVPYQTLVEAWGGSAWSVVPSPNLGALAMTTTSLPGGTAGSFYSATLSAIGGNPPYKWMLDSGGLPNGLKLHAASGVISGTPTAIGTSTFTVSVFDTKVPKPYQTQGTEAEQLSITVMAPPTPAVSMIHPVSGPTTGGNRVVITGTALKTVSAVTFGPDSASSYSVNAAGTKIIAYPPAEPAGTVDIRVTTLGGQAPASRQINTRLLGDPQGGAGATPMRRRAGFVNVVLWPR